jgi:type IV secretion system protein VirB11
MASHVTSLIYEHNAAPIQRHLQSDDVTELVIKPSFRSRSAKRPA